MHIEYSGGLMSSQININLAIDRELLNSECGTIVYDIWFSNW